MKNKIVTTINNESIDISKSRKIRGYYYKIGNINIKDSGDCFYMPITNKHVRLETGFLEFDYSISSYVYKSKSDLKKGVVNIENDKVKFGYFSIADKNNHPTIVVNGSKYIGLNFEIIKESEIFLEDLKSGYYYNRKDLPSKRFFEPIYCSEEYKRSLPYDSKGLTSVNMELYNKLYKPIYSKTCDKYGTFMKDLTFGLEFETNKGIIPKTICNRLGLLPLRDGSIKGLEYVTIPLQGKKGIQTVIDSLKELKKRTTYKDDCSLHLHIGNIPRTEEFFIALYKLLFLLQDSIFEMFPVFKKYNYGVKRKHYTKPLDFKNTIMLMDSKITAKNIKKNFGILYKHLSMGQDYDDMSNILDNVESHPSDPAGTGKWNIKTRYHWVNFIPLLFGNKQTVEFRIHTPTDDTTKVINYMILCSSLVNFTIDNQKAILEDFNSISESSIYDIIQSNLNTCDFKKDTSTLIAYVQDYYNNRRSHFYRAACQGKINENEKNFNSFSKGMGWDETKSNKLSYNTLRKDSNNISSLYKEVERHLNIPNRFRTRGSNRIIRENPQEGVVFNDIRIDEI